MHVRLLLGSSLLAASLLLAGCNSGPPSTAAPVNR